MITKTWIRHHLQWGAEIAVTPFFSIVHVTNTGVAFGLLQGRNYILAAIGIVFTIVLIVYAVRSQKTDPFLSAILGLITAGAWGNLIDRLAFGQVTDFLDFFAGAHHWPAFNVADSAICVGAALLIWDNLRRSKKAS